MPDPNSFDPNRVPDMRIPERTDKPKPPGAPQGNDGSFGTAPAMPGKWKIGDRVLAPWEPVFLYAGTIAKLTGSEALIDFDDGDSGWVQIAWMLPLAVQRGQHVLSRRRMGQLFYPAEVIEVRGEKVRVAFEDGHPEEETTVAAFRIPCDRKGEGARHVSTSSSQAFLKHLREGDRVWALWNGQAFFAGSITELREQQAHVQFDDGDQAWVGLNELMPLEIVVGMFVMGRWRMGANFYPGTITDFEGDRVHIRYDDGDEEWTQPAALALPLQRQPPPQAAPMGDTRGPAPVHHVAAPPPKPVGLYAIIGVLVVVVLGLLGWIATR